MIKVTEQDRSSWVKWLETYGAEKLFDSIIRNVQNVESECVHCGEKIYCDIVEGGGVPDWGTKVSGCNGLDYGCPDSPDTGEDGTGGHEPIRR